MISKILIGKTPIPVLEKGLDAASLRQKVIAENLANASTPGYRRREVVFEEQLSQALSGQGIVGTRTQPGHLPIGRRTIDSVEPEVREAQDTGNGTGVNDVDVEREMSSLAKNQIYYAYAARLVSRTFGLIRESIRGRSG